MVFFYDAETYRGLTRPAPLRSSYPAQWQHFVEDTKVLHFKTHYKRCASQCERMLRDQSGRLEPLHETFLHFFIAICNDSLGLAAHKFSSRKLSFLRLAKDAFTAALMSLPLPCASDHSEDNETCQNTSHSLNLDRVNIYCDGESDAAQPSELESCPSSLRTSDVKNSLHERCDSGYDSEAESLPVYNDKVPDFNTYSARQPLTELTSSNVSRIKTSSRAENRQQVDLDQNDLIPKPLFIKKRESDVKKPAAGRPLAPRPVPSPAHGQHKTAPRLPHHDNLTNASYSTSPPEPWPILQTQPPVPTHNPSSPPLDDYTTHLLTFRYLLTKHLASITASITTTTNLQQQHRLHHQSKRVASFWSFNPVLDGGAREEEEDAKAQEKKERIERLRASGWRVNKERHGWKGEAYYEDLRAGALADLGV